MEANYKDSDLSHRVRLRQFKPSQAHHRSKLTLMMPFNWVEIEIQLQAVIGLVC